MLVWVQYKYMYIILQKEVREENVWLGFRPSGTHYRFYQSLMEAQSTIQTERRNTPLTHFKRVYTYCVYIISKRERIILNLKERDKY